MSTYLLHTPKLKTLTRLGRVVFAVGVTWLGVLCFIYSAPVAGLEPVPAWVPGQLYWSYVTGVVLIGAGACLAINQGFRPAAVALGIVLLVWLILLQAPNLFARPGNGNLWTTTFETLALCGAAWVLAGSPAVAWNLRGRWDDLLAAAATAGRVCFGVSMAVFGALHFVYAHFVASLVPVWMPRRLFWAYFTGAAFVAAGVSIVTRVKATLAATLVGAMFGAWVLLLHAPRVAVKLRDRNEWTSLLIATAMCGGAWLLAGTLARENRVNDLRAELSGKESAGG